jgi:hypothetical protein
MRANNGLIELQQDPMESSEICIELPGYAKPAKTYASYIQRRDSGDRSTTSVFSLYTC